jgi:hypothetical protein
MPAATGVAVADQSPATQSAGHVPSGPIAKTSAAALVGPTNAELYNKSRAMRQARDPAIGGNFASLSQLPQRAPVRPATPSSPNQQIKPFHAMQSGPTVSPYLNLYRDENDSEGAPNYYAFVKPQMEQIEANRASQLEIQRLQRQVQGGNVAKPQYRAAATPPSGGNSAARYMDTAQYYSGWQR